MSQIREVSLYVWLLYGLTLIYDGFLYDYMVREGITLIIYKCLSDY